MRAYSTEDSPVGQLDRVRLVHIRSVKSFGEIDAANLLPSLAVVGTLVNVDRALIQVIVTRMEFLADEKKLAVFKKNRSVRCRNGNLDGFLPGVSVIARKTDEGAVFVAPENLCLGEAGT